MLRAAISSDVGLASYTVRDDFNQSAGALSGKTLAVGGTWAGAGDADDFAVEATGHTAQRTATGDTSTTNGRYAIAGTGTAAAVVVQTDLKTSVITDVTGTAWQGVIARYVDTSNWLAAFFKWGGAPFATSRSVQLAKRVGGTLTVLRSVQFTSFEADTFHTLRVMADTAGRATVYAAPVGSPVGNPLIRETDSDLATGGALAGGKVGLYDVDTGAGAATRNYTSVQAWVPTSDAVVFANQSAELRWDGMFREDSAGAAWGPVSNVEGDLLRLPPSGLEGRTVQVMVKGSRGDFDQLPDSATGDDISVQAFYRPSWLFVPGS